MKLAVGLCSSHSRASFSFVNGLRPFSDSYAKNIQAECGFCRMLHCNKASLRNHVVLSTACDSGVSRFDDTTRRTVSPLIHPQRKCDSSKSRAVSTFTDPTMYSSSNTLVLRCPSSIVLAAKVPQHLDTPQRSEEWFALRKDKLTTSTFSTALGFWKGTRRHELWSEKVFESGQTQDDDGARNLAMNWGVRNESAAIEKYRTITGREVVSMGFAIHAEERYGWLGASPDGVLSCFELGGGVLEVKCPYNKGNPEKGLPWSKTPFYYMPQAQGQLEIMDREWLDLYCWTPNGSSIFRVRRDREYWDLIHGVLREFWWENVVPAREALALGKEENEVVELYKPSSTHKLTGLAIAKSINLAAEAKMLCREIAGHVEFFGS